MSREIKCRAWDIEDKVMYSNAQDTYDYGADGCEVPAESFKVVLGNERFVVMQFIGLKDIKSKDIYEGDIIPWTTLTGEVFNGVVKYADKWAQFYLSVRNNVGGGAAMDSTFIWYYGENGEVIAEVIGNIYENPDLVKEDVK